MKMIRLEKWLVNRPLKGAANVAAVRTLLDTLGRVDLRCALELGCGTGEVAAFLAKEAGYDVVALDVDQGQIAIARDRHGADPSPRFVVGDAADLDFADGFFDLVVAQNVFHHLPGWRRVVSEISRVLRPAGYLLWLDLALPPSVKGLFRPLSPWVGVYSVADVQAAFHDAGLGERVFRRTPFWLPIRHEAVMQRGSGAPARLT